MKKHLLLFSFSVFILSVPVCSADMSDSYGSPAPAQTAQEQAPEQQTQQPAAASAPKTYAKPRVLVS